MAKIKIYELSKELGVDNKVIISFLNDKGINVTSHMNALEDDVAKQVRQAFKKPAAKKEPETKEKPAAKKEPEMKEKPAANKEPAAKEKPAARKNPETEKETAGEEAPKKKKYVQVFRPQNTQNGNKRPRRAGSDAQQQAGTSQRRPVQVNNGRPSRRQLTPAEQAAARAKAAQQKAAQQKAAQQKAAQERAAQERAAQERAAQAKGQESAPRPVRPAGTSGTQSARPVKPAGTPAEKSAGEKTARPVRTTGAQAPKPADTHAVKPAETKKSDTARTAGPQERSQEKTQERASRTPNARGERSPRGQNENQRTGGRKNAAPQMPAADTTSQKPSRGKGKGNKEDYKKKDYRRDEEERMPRGRRQKNVSEPEMQKPQPKPKKKEEEIKSIEIPEKLTIQELADKMKVAPSDIIKKLFLQGQVVTINQEVDYETAENIALEYNILCEKEETVDVIEELLKEEEDDPGKMKRRPPVVCVMGHVDHGKTSLLDAIRHTNVISGEAGGITQAIGASVVKVNDETITFLDTPGHEAFTAMRMRGANSTDIAVLVVAADDGVMPQTVEAINHAKAANVEIVVAINKIDKPGADVDRVKRELMDYDLVPEDWGGSTVCVPVSAKTGEGLEELMEMILLTAEVMELKADPDRKARGIVLEAKLDKGRGPVATVLVQKGTLKIGDAVAVGAAHGKVRAMTDDKGKRVKEAGPSVPVEIQGLNDVPEAGEVVVVCDSEKEARNFAETFIDQHKEELLEDTKVRLSLDDLFDQIQAGNLKELNLVIKADVQGSVEALKQSLLKLSNEEVVVKVIHGGVGAINESDVSLASASNAIIIGFNVRPDAVAKETAEQEGVDIRIYQVIYNAIEDVEAALKGMLEPVYKEQVTGHAEIRQIFKASGVGNIAGSYVLDGSITRDSMARVSRDGSQIFEGKLASLKRGKDDAKEVKAGYECGMVFEDFNAIKEGDQVEAYSMVEIPR